MTIRQAAVAGTFYPGEPEALAREVTALLREASPPESNSVKALIVPHAGYVYSGVVAAAAYRLIERRAFERVVLVGPAHRVHLRGMAVPAADAFRTPLGDVSLDADGIRTALEVPHTVQADDAHQLEHSLEVQLPFLQQVIGEFKLIPVVVGDARPNEVAALLEALWGGDETLIVVSSDLSHYYPYDEARRRDAATCADILARSQALVPEQACGAYSVNGLLAVAAARGLEIRLLDRRTSGDTAGDRYQVVGYAAFALLEPGSQAAGG